MSTKSRGGRPNRAMAAAKALLLAQKLGVDGAFDPIVVLRSIASDCSSPASARVQACRILLELQSNVPQEQADPISARAITLLAGNGRAN